MAELNAQQIEQIVKQVLTGLESAGQSKPAAAYSSTAYNGRPFIGIYSDMNEAIENANNGYKAVRAMSVEQREKLLPLFANLPAPRPEFWPKWALPKPAWARLSTSA